MKQMSRRMTNIPAVVSELIGLARRLVHSRNVCPNVLFQFSLNIELLLFTFSRNRRIKGCFHFRSFDQPYTRCSVCGIDSHRLIFSMNVVGAEGVRGEPELGHV